jgi:hypothetical protein
VSAALDKCAPFRAEIGGYDGSECGVCQKCYEDKYMTKLALFVNVMDGMFGFHVIYVGLLSSNAHSNPTHFMPFIHVAFGHCAVRCAQWISCLCQISAHISVKITLVTQIAQQKAL